MALRKIILFTIAGVLSYSCASTEGTTSSTPQTNSLFPSWYSTAGFQTDSLAFRGFGTSIASDSALAISRAIENARLQLDLEIGKLAENVRTELETNGDQNVTNRDFILILRNAHADAVNEATSSNSSAQKFDGAYRGFASVHLERSELVLLLEKGFTGHPRYWGAYSGSETFQNSFK